MSALDTKTIRKQETDEHIIGSSYNQDEELDGILEGLNSLNYFSEMDEPDIDNIEKEEDATTAINRMNELLKGGLFQNNESFNEQVDSITDISEKADAIKARFRASMNEPTVEEPETLFEYDRPKITKSSFEDFKKAVNLTDETKSVNMENVGRNTDELEEMVSGTTYNYQQTENNSLNQDYTVQDMINDIDVNQKNNSKSQGFRP